MDKGRALDVPPALLVRLGQQWGLYGPSLLASVARELCQVSEFTCMVTGTPAVSLIQGPCCGHNLSSLSILGTRCRRMYTI